MLLVNGREFILRWWNFKYLFNVYPPKLGEDEPIFLQFFKWVGSTHQLFGHFLGVQLLPQWSVLSNFPGRKAMTKHHPGIKVDPLPLGRIYQIQAVNI